MPPASQGYSAPHGPGSTDPGTDPGFLPNFAKAVTVDPMSTMNVSLPEALKDFVDEQVGACGYGSSSEYVRKLIREDRDRQRLRALLLDGAASPPTGAVRADYFDQLRGRIRDLGAR